MQKKYFREFESRISNMNMTSRKNRTTEPNVLNRENSSSLLSGSNMSNSQYQNQIVASKLSEVYIWGGGKLAPKQIDIFKGENAPLHLACGSTHYAVINVEKELYTVIIVFITVKIIN